MWPFSESNEAIITAKRAQRAEALAGIPQSVNTQPQFTKATGAFDSYVYHRV